MRSFSPRTYWVVVSCVVVLTVIRVANTHLTFAQVMDEPVHVAAGHEWLTKRVYHLECQHPPIPRALFALPFTSYVTQHPADPSEYGNDLYAVNDRYIHNVAAARRGNLVFLVIAMLAVAATARRLFGEATACVALMLFASLPPVLAHSGLATTDMAAVAGFALSFYALLLWTETPTVPRSILLGASIGFGIVCKYSFALFFLPAMIVVLIARRRLAVKKLMLAAAAAFIVVWGTFGFSFATMAESNPRYAAFIAEGAGVSTRWTQFKIPAPDLALGLLAVQFHNRLGHYAYLLGRISYDGWWYYFPVALAVKTPIPYLLLASAGAWLLAKRRRREVFLLFVAAVILAVAMSSRINIGVRHILPIYVPLSIVGAYAVVELWRTGRAARLAVGSGALWLVLSGALAHPDYIPWMNALAGKNPHRVLLDSNFDWGQDIWRLARICRKRGITSLGYAVTTTVRPSSIGITGGHMLSDTTPSRGWLVISEGNLELARVGNPAAFEWLERQGKFERVGKTLRLYYVP